MPGGLIDGEKCGCCSFACRVCPLNTPAFRGANQIKVSFEQTLSHLVLRKKTEMGTIPIMNRPGTDGS